MSETNNTPSESEKTSGPPPILGIFLAVFLDLLGFGMFIPDLQLRGKLLATQYLGATGTLAQIGTLTGISLASFSLAQLLTSPMLGQLSDRIGRKKILVLTSVLASLSYVVYAHAQHFETLIVARVISGIGAANIGVAFAYVADVTKPQDRAKGLGALGAAFGLGFVVGPPLGGFILLASNDNPLVLGYVAAGLSAVNAIYIAFFLRESLVAKAEGKSSFVANVKLAFSDRRLAILLIMFFAINLAFTNLETTYFQVLADARSIFHLSDEDAKFSGSLVLGFVGVVAAFVQGYLVRKVTPIYGEVKILRFAYLFYAPVFAAIPFTPLWIPALIGIALLGLCNGLTQPSLSSLISRSAPATIQGGIFGITQALGAIARCIGPLVSNRLFAEAVWGPYALGAGIIVLPAVVAWTIKMPDDTGETPDLASAVH